MIDTVDCVVVGAGVVGLAVARALALQGREVMVLEATDAIGTGTSSRNSEVIHAGLYYPAGSLKARLCVRGKELLYAYCAERGVPHRRCGKLLVATSAAQLDSLEGIQARARANGVLDLQRLSREEALEMEPALASSDFTRLGERLARLGLPTAFVLEGGYAAAELGTNAVNVLDGFEQA